MLTVSFAAAAPQRQVRDNLRRHTLAARKTKFLLYPLILSCHHRPFDIAAWALSNRIEKARRNVFPTAHFPMQLRELRQSTYIFLFPSSSRVNFCLFLVATSNVLVLSSHLANIGKMSDSCARYAMTISLT